MKTRPIDSTDLHQLQREYDLSLRLLELGQQRELKPFLQEALALVVEAVEARQGYLELYDDRDADEARWWMAHGFTTAELSSVRSALSRGIIAEALASGQTVVTPSAVLDPRFGANESVRRGQIDAVLCSPIGSDPPRGVLYLQGRAAPGLFAPAECTRAEIFARHLAPLADRLLLEHSRRQGTDATTALRSTLRLDGVIGRSQALAAALKQAALVAPLDIHVLITGECGTGKSQLARVIHENSPRSAAPYIEINCAAIPEALVESELFGAEKGAHSQADRRIEGKVAAAEGGTLVLDEVALLTAAAQGKLLQLLHSKQYYPLGSARPITADVRVIAATNADLKQAVADRTFRDDLFFRLQVLPIRMPSMAERREDVAELAPFFCANACQRHTLPRLELSRGALSALESAAWPGNVRELDYAIQAAAIRAAGEGVAQIETRHLFPDSAHTTSEPADLTFQEATRQFQSQMLRRTLQDTDWNVVETARRLDLARSHVYNLIKVFGLARGA
ncbi:MAG: sigma 54-interacting transcriptional regulator [bacterium]